MTMSGDQGKPGARQARGFRRASDSARKQLGQAAARYGFAEADVLFRWPEVTGEALSGLCRPVRVRYPRSRALGATLVVEAIGARAPEVEMQAPRIIERVNSFYGYRAISRLKVTQTGACDSAGFAEDQQGFQGPATPNGDARMAGQAREMAGRAENPELRAALTRLGTYVLARARRTYQPGHGHIGRRDSGGD